VSAIEPSPSNQTCVTCSDYALVYVFAIPAPLYARRRLGGKPFRPLRSMPETTMDKAPTERRAARAVGEAQRLPAHLNLTISVRQARR